MTARERPRNRKKIEKFLTSNPNISLADIVRGYYVDDSGHKHNLYFSNGMRTQCRKMLQEHYPYTTTKRVRIKGKCIELDTGNPNYTYRLDLSRCDSERKMFHSINHLIRKTWVTKEMLDDFIILMCRHFNINTANRNLKPVEGSS